MFDQERGFERGEGREFAIPLIAFLIYMLWTYSPHTDISHVGGHLPCGLLFSFIFVQLDRGLIKSQKNLFREKIPIDNEVIVRKLATFLSKFGVRQGS